MKLSLRKKRVAVIFGGTGPEHSVSVKSAEFIISALKKTEYIPVPVYITKSGAWKIYFCGERPSEIAVGGAVGIKTFPIRLGCRGGFFVLGRVVPFYAAIPLVHGEGGEDGAIAAALTLAGVDFVGADTVSSALAYNKAYTKTVAESLGIPTVPWVYLNSHGDGDDLSALADSAREALGEKLFVKPATLGSSVGCSVAVTRDELISAIGAARALDGGVLVEKLLDSPRELEIGYLSTKCNEIFTNPGEIRLDGGFYSYDEKYSKDSTARVCSCAELTDGEREELLLYARRLVGAIGIKDMCRVDFFLCGGRIYFNEINTVPGMTEASLYPLMLSESGVSPKDLAEQLVALAVARNDRRF